MLIACLIEAAFSILSNKENNLSSREVRKVILERTGGTGDQKS